MHTHGNWYFFRKTWAETAIPELRMWVPEKNKNQALLVWFIYAHFYLNGLLLFDLLGLFGSLGSSSFLDLLRRFGLFALLIDLLNMLGLIFGLCDSCSWFDLSYLTYLHYLLFLIYLVWSISVFCSVSSFSLISLIPWCRKENLKADVGTDWRLQTEFPNNVSD